MASSPSSHPPYSSEPEDTLLPHTSYNSNAPSTLLLIHSAFTSRADWSLVLSHLLPPQNTKENYHILLPDLPGHGAASHLPYTLPLAAQKCAELIRARAKNGVAHVVGLSLGATVALEVATTYSDVVDTCVLSGFTPMGGNEGVGKWLPQALWLQDRALRLLPSVVLRGLMSGAEFDTTAPQPSRELIAAVAARNPHPWPARAWPARTLVFAAGKSGLLPTADSAEDARKLEKTGSNDGGSTMTQAWTHADMRHPWHRQEPGMFARMVVAWIEGAELPEGFERL